MDELGVVIFDLDGTLVDAMDQHADAFAEVLARAQGIPVALSREHYLATAGRHLDEQLIGAIERSGMARPADVRPLMAAFDELVAQMQPRLFPDVRPAIERLSGAGYVLAVTSSGSPAIVKAKLQKTGIARYFCFRLGTDKSVAGMEKGPGHFALIRLALGLSQEEFRRTAALVGDGEFDMRIADDAGLLAIGRRTGANEDALYRAGAAVVVGDLTGVVGVLEDRATGEARLLPVDQARRSIAS